MCIPEPKSPEIGFGMNVAYTPTSSAIFFTTWRNEMTLSAIVNASVYRRSISCWLGPSSWWLYSTGMPIASRVTMVCLRRFDTRSVVRSKNPAWSSGSGEFFRREVEVLHLGSDVEGEPLLPGSLHVPLQDEPRVALEGLVRDAMDVTEDQRRRRLVTVPGDDLEGVGIRDQEHVGLLDPAVALDRGPVEGHALLEGDLELGRRDLEALEEPEHVGEPQADEAHPALLDGAQDVVVLCLHAASLAGDPLRPGGRDPGSRGCSYGVHSQDQAARHWA